MFVSGVIRYDEFTDSDENVVRATTILAGMLAIETRFGRTRKGIRYTLDR